MTTMISEVYDALISEVSTEDKARKAAEAIAAHEHRFNSIDRDITLLKWMTGFILTAGCYRWLLSCFLALCES